MKEKAAPIAIFAIPVLLAFGLIAWLLFGRGAGGNQKETLLATATATTQAAIGEPTQAPTNTPELSTATEEATLQPTETATSAPTDTPTQQPTAEPTSTATQEPLALQGQWKVVVMNDDGSQPLEGASVTIIFNPSDSITLISNDQGVVQYDQAQMPDIDHQGLVSVRSEQGAFTILPFFELDGKLILADPTTKQLVPLGGGTDVIYITSDEQASLTEGLTVKDGHVLESCDDQCAQMMIMAIARGQSGQVDCHPINDDVDMVPGGYYLTYRFDSGFSVDKAQVDYQNIDLAAGSYRCTNQADEVFYVTRYGQVAWLLFKSEEGQPSSQPTSQPPIQSNHSSAGESQAPSNEDQVIEPTDSSSDGQVIESDGSTSGGECSSDCSPQIELQNTPEGQSELPTPSF